MSKNSILSRHFGQVTKSSPEPFGLIKNCLTKSNKSAYFIDTCEKSVGQILHSEFIKIDGRILYGFFCARKIRHAMTGCIEESSGSPCSFMSGSANSVQPVTLRFAPKVTVSLFVKETAPCL